jgi:hypothetical protein
MICGFIKQKNKIYIVFILLFFFFLEEYDRN